MQVIIIAAMAANRVIGDRKTNDIPWRVPGEQLHFKAETMGHPLIMGRKTYDSIGRPLPGRQMVIITRNDQFAAPGCLVAHSLSEALAHCRNQGNSKVYIIGGEGIFRQTIGCCSHIVLTTLTRPAHGDIFFPELPRDAFVLEGSATIRHPEPYTIKRYRRVTESLGQENASECVGIVSGKIGA